MTLPRHSDRNSSVAESVGQYSEISWSSGHCDDGVCDDRSVHHEEDGHPRPPHWHAGLQTITVQGQGCCESLNI